MKVFTMFFVIPVLTFYLITHGSAQGRVLNEIIDILAENPRTRAMFLHSIAVHREYPPHLGLVHPVGLDNRYLYALSRQLPQVVPLSDGSEGYFNMADKAARAPLLQDIKSVGGIANQMTGAGTEQPDVPLEPPVLPKNPTSACENKLETGEPGTSLLNNELNNDPQAEGSKCASQQNSANNEPSGVALDINGDMKANIPYELQMGAQPGAVGGMVPVPVPLNNNVQYMPRDDHYYNHGPLSDELFEKKRTIIRELKSLFQVILDGDVTKRRMRRRRVHMHPFHRARIANHKRNKLNQNASMELKGAKRGKISTSPPRSNKRIVLYRKLINDLNDLITLEISKNNKTNAFEGVEQLAPAKLRRTIPKPPPKVVKQ